MRATKRQHGATAAEFSLCAVTFFTVIFFVLEAARALYLMNTLQEVTRRAARAAAVADFSDPAVMAGVRQTAILRDGPGGLVLGAPVTDAHIRIDYLSLARSDGGGMTMTPIAAADLPAWPARARLNCTADPNGANCIRFVQASLCAPGGGECGVVPYQPLLPLSGLRFNLPASTAISRAESLGYRPGATLCP